MVDFLSIGAGFRSFKSFPDQSFGFQIHTVGTELLNGLLLLGIKYGGEYADASQSKENQDTTFHGKLLEKNENGERPISR